MKHPNPHYGHAQEVARADKFHREEIAGILKLKHQLVGFMAICKVADGEYVLHTGGNADAFRRALADCNAPHPTHEEVRQICQRMHQYVRVYTSVHNADKRFAGALHYAQLFPKMYDEANEVHAHVSTHRTVAPTPKAHPALPGNQHPLQDGQESHQEEGRPQEGGQEERRQEGRA